MISCNLSLFCVGLSHGALSFWRAETVPSFANFRASSCSPHTAKRSINFHEDLNECVVPLLSPFFLALLLPQNNQRFSQTERPAGVKPALLGSRRPCLRSRVSPEPTLCVGSAAPSAYRPAALHRGAAGDRRGALRGPRPPSEPPRRDLQGSAATGASPLTKERGRSRGAREALRDGASAHPRTAGGRARPPRKRGWGEPRRPAVCGGAEPRRTGSAHSPKPARPRTSPRPPRPRASASRRRKCCVAHFRVLSGRRRRASPVSASPPPRVSGLPAAAADDDDASGPGARSDVTAMAGIKGGPGTLDD